MKLLHFRLSSVLIAFTVVALLLAYTQVRRRDLGAAFADLGARGCDSGWEDHWLWPAVPEFADVIFRELPSGEWSLEYTRPEYAERFDSMNKAVERFKSLRSEALALGIERVQFQKLLTDPRSRRESVCTYDLGALELELELARIPASHPDNY